MSNRIQDPKAIDDFFRGIEPFEHAQRDITFSYLAIRTGDSYVIWQAALVLANGHDQASRDHVRTANVRAGKYFLSELRINSPRALVEAAIGGELETPDGPLKFVGASDGICYAYYLPFDDAGAHFQSRYDSLRLVGGRRSELNLASLDWELRASESPYDGLQDVANEFSLGLVQGDVAIMDVRSLNVAAVDASSSIDGTVAHPTVLLVKGLDVERASLGYRVVYQGQVIERGTIDERSMEWTTDQQVQRGKCQIDIQKGAIVQCFAAYAGLVQNFYWLVDPNTVQNPQRAMYQGFDPRLDVLISFLNKSGKGRDARDLEVGVAWLFWMLGFSVANLGGTSRTQDAADLIAMTPARNVAVVECTTGTLRTESKLSLLVSRTEDVRRSLVASGNQHLRVLPVIVTTLTRGDVRADLDQAEKLGIYVVTRETLDRLLDRTLFWVDADALYRDAEQDVQMARDRHERPGQGSDLN